MWTGIRRWQIDPTYPLPALLKADKRQQWEQSPFLVVGNVIYPQDDRAGEGSLRIDRNHEQPWDKFPLGLQIGSMAIAMDMLWGLTVKSIQTDAPTRAPRKLLTTAKEFEEAVYDLIDNPTESELYEFVREWGASYTWINQMIGPESFDNPLSVPNRFTHVLDRRLFQEVQGPVGNLSDILARAVQGFLDAYGMSGMGLTFGPGSAVMHTFNIESLEEMQDSIEGFARVYDLWWADVMETYATRYPELI